MGTLRQQMASLLEGDAMDLRTVSQTLGISEKEVSLHLPHIAKSVTAKGQRFAVQPARCAGCKYTFTNRQRLTPPGRCPRCRQSRIRGPWYQVIQTK